jgi:hypothetical protein
LTKEGCPAKLVSFDIIEIGTETSFANIRNKNVCFSCFASVLKLRVSVLRFKPPKQPKQRKLGKFILREGVGLCICVGVGMGMNVSVGVVVGVGFGLGLGFV